MSERLTLLPGQWYGCTMYPGYGDGTYHSPIWVRHVQPMGNRRFTLEYLNLAYAAGVQMMAYDLETLNRQEQYLIAAIPASDRSVVIEPLTTTWFRNHLPHAYDIMKGYELNSGEDEIAQWLMLQTSVHLDAKID